MRLDPLPIHFDEEAHRYCWQPTGEWMAYSVTRVTGFSKTAKQVAALKATQHIWEPRGKHVHACLETFLNGEALLNPGEYEEWVQPLLAHSFWDTVTPVAVEYRVCDRRRSVGGSLDALVRNKATDKLILIDLKTQGDPKASVYSTDAQLGGYLQMLIDHHRLTIDHCRTVWCRPGKTIVGKAQPADQCSLAWSDAWDAFSYQLNYL